jgi:hypothetical protein
VVDFVGIGIKGGDGGDVVLLALGLGAGGFRPRDGGRALGDPARHRRPPQRIAEPGDGRAPVGNATGRIGGGDGVEGLDCLTEPERVLQRYGALELRLHGRAARGREVDLAQPFGRLRAGLRRRRGERRCEHRDPQSDHHRARTEHRATSGRAAFHECRRSRKVYPRWHRSCSTTSLEESAMATRRKPTVQLPDPTSMTEAAIDAGVRAVEMTAAVARGLARGAMTAARAMADGGAQATEQTTKAATSVVRDAGERAKRAASRATPRAASRPTPRKVSGPRRASRKPTRRRRTG